MKSVTPEEAASVLREGAVALVPTETVVGLVANEEGLRKVYEMKGRDPAKPIALLCRSAEEAFFLAAEVPPLARRLAELYWPGPLTLVLRSKEDGAVGVRVPRGVVRAVLEAYGGPLYATSANPSGDRAPESWSEVATPVREKVNVVVEGSPGSGEASAVVDFSGEKPKVLRSTRSLNEEVLRRLAE